MADHLIDADAIIVALAKGEIGYDTFAAKILAHPAMAINRRIDDTGQYYEDTTDNAFRVFMGRTPTGAEQLDFTNLFRVWRKDFVDRYALDYSYYVRVATLNPYACQDPVYGEAACTSTQLGETVTVKLPITDTLEYETIQGSVPADLQAELEKAGRLLATRDEFWDEAADHALSRLLGEELDAITSTASTCLPDQSCGMDLYAQELCGALLRSGAFIFY
jgi:hypothetical protein